MKKTDFNRDWIYRYNDSAETEAVTLPHDAMLHSPRNPDSPGGNAIGFFEGGVYTYEKEWMVPDSWAEKSVWMEFGGIYKNAHVYLNEEQIAWQPYGYTTFAVCLDAYMMYGRTNHIKVVADNSGIPNSRWYSGGGIYRPVWLYIGNRNHILWQGVRITTKSVEPAVILVETKIAGNGKVTVEILDGEVKIASAVGNVIELKLEGVRLWNHEDPYLYTCKVTLEDENGMLDSTEELFGIRRIEWDTDGLRINGRNTLLKGACIHHDNGILGSCTYPEAEERRIRRLKEFGFNAIRMAHHPAGREVLDACDKCGMYLMDEAFDMWYEHKNPYDYATDFKDWYERDLKAMVDKDYNHPSVIMYSIGNEVSEPRNEKGMQTARQMIAQMHRMDSTRPVTAGINLVILCMASLDIGTAKEERHEPEEDNEREPVGSLFFNNLMQKIGGVLHFVASLKAVDKITAPILDAMDIAGYNYGFMRYRSDRKKHPDRIIVGSETMPYTISKNWKMVEKYPNLVGDFMWTGWDYMGEAAIGSWNYEGVKMDRVPYPWLLADVGAFDITGHPGAEAYCAKAVFTGSALPYIGVQPVSHSGEKLTRNMWRGTNAIDSWTWKDCAGNKTRVEVYAQAHSVSLSRNGKIVGKKRLKNHKAVFRTKYEPGVLLALTYDREGREIGRNELRTAGTTRLCVCPETQEVQPGELLYVNILIADDQGIVEAGNDQNVRIAVENGRLLGCGSANPCTEESYLSDRTRTYYGRAQIVVLSGDDGEVKIQAFGENGKSAVTFVKIR